MDINTLLEELINVIKWKYFTNIIALTSLTLPIILSALGLLIGLYRKYSSEKRLHVYQTKEDKIKLKKYYIQTKGGFDDPCDKEEIIESIDKNRINLINYFIHDVIHNDKYGKYFIVLADSGMGKTTFIQKLYLKYARKVFRRYKIQFFPLTNYFELDEIEKIADKYKTVLLLDALDEDKYAMQNYKNRVGKILKVTQEFYKVIITSRTQFFPNRESEPNKTGYITYGTGKKINHFHKIYLSPFSNTDVNKYIRKKFVLSYKKRIKAKKIIDKCPNLMARPMLLSHIDGLMKHDKEYNDINDIYEILIDEWISREPDNEDFDKELSIEFIKKVVLYMFKENKIYINIDELESLCSINDLSKIEPIYGRTKSLLNRNGLGEYKFAHRSIFEFLVSKLAIENVDMRERLLKMIIKNEIANIYYKYFSLKMIAAFRNNDCISCIFLYLTNEDLSGTILTEADLTGTILRETNLEGADLRGTDLKNILVASAVFDIDIAEKLLKQKEVSGIETIKVYDISLRKFYTYVEFIRHRNNTKW